MRLLQGTHKTARRFRDVLYLTMDIPVVQPQVQKYDSHFQMSSNSHKWEIWCFHGCEDSSRGLLGCDAV